MLIRLGYDIRFTIAQPVPIVSLLSVHPSRRHDLQGPDRVTVDSGIEATEYIDAFGNICTRLVAPPGTLRLTNSVVVQDSGPGIPPELVPNLFDRFMRGSGLGLPTAKRLIEAHKGHLVIDCPPEGGTTIVVHLPTARA